MWQKIEGYNQLYEILKQDGYDEKEYIGCDINDFYAFFKYSKS